MLKAKLEFIEKSPPKQTSGQNIKFRPLERNKTKCRYCQPFGGGGMPALLAAARRPYDRSSKYCLPSSLNKKMSPKTPTAVPIGNERQHITEATMAQVRAHGL